MRRVENVLRHSALVVAIIAVFACVTAEGASAAPLLWTANHDSKSVSTINTGTSEVVGNSIPVGEFPNSIAMTPNGRQAFVATSGGEDITAINTATRIPTSISVGEAVERVAVSPDGQTAYFTTEGSEKVFVIDTATDTIARSFQVGPEPLAIAFSPSGSRAYIGAKEGVYVIETATGKVVGGPISVGGFAIEEAVSPDGKSVYVVASGVNAVAVINAALGQVVGHILTSSQPESIAVSPSGARVYVASEAADTVTIAEAATNQVVGSPIAVPGGARAIAITPDGTTAFAAGGDEVTPINLLTDNTRSPIKMPIGSDVDQLVVAPDQSPTAVFAAPTAFATFPVIFDGSASTDPDGTISSYEWAFGDGAVASGGPTFSHTYRAPGTYNAQLSVLDNEGCGSEEVFTGRTAYCSGNPLATAAHPVTVAVPTAVCSSKFSFGSMIHNRKNGTVRLQVRLRSTGSLLLFGKKVHAVTRKVKKAGSMFLTIHARVELNKRLKKIHRTSVRIRITFTPAAGCGFKTVHRSILLLRAPKHHHR